VEWRYNTSTRDFTRYLDNQKYVTASGAAISAANVVVQIVGTDILDDVGRLSVDTVGNGEAKVFRAGKLVRGTWKKDTDSGRTRFYDENNQEIEFIPGSTWVEVVPRSGAIDIVN
jgi:hypothetical protein